MAKDDKGKGKSGGGGGIIGLLLVTLLAAGGGAGFGFFLHGKMQTEAANKPVEAPKEATPAAPAVPVISKLVEMEPIVANLAEPTDAWMRIEATVLIEGMPEGADALASKVREDIAAYLKTTRLSQFEGPSGFINLREDLLDRAKVRDAKHVKDVIIHGVVVE